MPTRGRFNYGLTTKDLQAIEERRIAWEAIRPAYDTLVVPLMEKAINQAVADGLFTTGNQAMSAARQNMHFNNNSDKNLLDESDYQRNRAPQTKNWKGPQWHHNAMTRAVDLAKNDPQKLLSLFREELIAANESLFVKSENAAADVAHREQAWASRNGALENYNYSVMRDEADLANIEFDIAKMKKGLSRLFTGSARAALTVEATALRAKIENEAAVRAETDKDFHHYFDTGMYRGDDYGIHQSKNPRPEQAMSYHDAKQLADSTRPITRAKQLKVIRQP